MELRWTRFCLAYVPSLGKHCTLFGLSRRYFLIDLKSMSNPQTKRWIFYVKFDCNLFCFSLNYFDCTEKTGYTYTRKCNFHFGYRVMYASLHNKSKTKITFQHMCGKIYIKFTPHMLMRCVKYFRLRLTK